MVGGVMNNKLDSIGYLCICMDEIPDNFEPLGTSREQLFSKSTIGIKEIFLYLANLYHTDRLDALMDIIDNLNIKEDFEELEESDINAIEVSLKPVIDERYIRLFTSYIVAENYEEYAKTRRDIFGMISMACMVANNYAKCLCNPTELRESGMENRGRVMAMIGVSNDVGLAFKTNYRPIMGYCGDTFTYLDSLSFENFLSIVNMAALSILKNEVVIHKCRNCGDYFIPASRSDELYCNKILENGKTCKTIGYDERVKGDNILREYRKIYKTQNARKQRNAHIPGISERFDTWRLFAKQCLRACQAGELTLDELRVEISGDKWVKGQQ